MATIRISGTPSVASAILRNVEDRLAEMDWDSLEAKAFSRKQCQRGRTRNALKGPNVSIQQFIELRMEDLGGDVWTKEMITLDCYFAGFPLYLVSDYFRLGLKNIKPYVDNYKKCKAQSSSVSQDTNSQVKIPSPTFSAPISQHFPSTRLPSPTP